MSKQLFMTTGAASAHRGTIDAKLNAANSYWLAQLLSEARGAGGSFTSVNAATVAGPTNGIEVINVAPIEWISEPLSADFTISGAITYNLWANETSMTDNAAVNIAVDKIDGATGAITRIATSTNATELGTTSAATNLTVTPTSTACKRGDRLRVRVFADDGGGTMAASGPMVFSYNRNAAGVQGDSYVQFTENLTFELAGDPGIIDQTTGGSTQITGDSGATNQQLGQAFVAKESLTEVRAWLSKTGTPTDNLIIEIQSDVSNTPSGTVIGTVATVSGSSLTSTLTQYTYSALGISLTKGTQYWMVFRRSGSLSTTDKYNIGTTPSGSSNFGFNFFSVALFNYTGSSWTAAGGGGVFGTLRLGFSISTYYLTDTAFPISVPYLEAPNDLATNAFGTTLFEQYAQSFIASDTLTEIRAWLNKNGSPTDNVIIEIQSDSSGSPSGTVIGTVTTFAASSLTTTSTQYTYACSITLTPGTKYWVVFRRSGSLDNANSPILFRSFEPIGVAKYGTPPSWTTDGNGVALRITCGSTPMTGSLSKASLTTRGSGSINTITNTVTGPVTPIQIIQSSGAATQWYTPALNAFTLGGKAKFNIRGLESAIAANASLKAEIAICANDGSSPVVWGVANVEAITTYGSVGELNTADTAYNAWVSGDDTTVSLNQRLRFRIFVDDTGNGPLVTGSNVTVSYNGATPAAAGDTFVILPVAVTEAPTGAVYTDTATAATVTSVLDSFETDDFAEVQTITNLSAISAVEDAFFTDNATIVSVTTPSAVDTKEVLDSATIASKITLTATEVAALVDANTVGTVSAISAIETTAFVNAATLATVTIPSGSDIYSVGGVAYTEANTIAGVTSLASIEIHEIPDVATIASATALTSTEVAGYVDAQTASTITVPSAAEVHEIPDSATTSSVTVITSVEIAAYVDSQTASSKTNLSSVEIAPSDAATISGVSNVSATEVAAFVNTATIGGTTTPSGIDASALLDTGTISGSTNPSGTDFAAYLDSGTVVSNSSGTSGIELAGFSDVSTTGGITTLTSDEQFSHGNQETSTLAVVTTLGSVEVAAYVDAATSQTTTTPSSVELRIVSDAATVTSSSVLSSVETAQFVDAATNTSITIPSATEIKEITDAGTVSSTTVLASIEIAAYTDTLTVASVTALAAIVEIRELFDSGIVTSKTTPSAVEVVVVVESTSPGSATTISSTDLAAYVDTQIVSSVTTPSGVEGILTGKTDADTVVGTVTPSAIEIAAYVDQTTISGKTGVTSSEGGFTDSNTIPVFTTPATSDIVVFIDSNVPSNTTSLFAIEQATDQDTSIVSSTSTLSYSDIAVYLESATIVSRTTFAGTEFTGAGFSETNTISTQTRVSYVEQPVYVETSTLVSRTSLTDLQITVYTDASVLASSTYPSAVEVIKVPLFDFATVKSITTLEPVEFVGLLSELAVMAAYFRWNTSITYSRWYAPVPGFLRWGGKPLNGRLTTKVTRKWAAWKP